MKETRPSGRIRTVQTIVLIDGNVGFRDELATALTAAGHRVITADAAETGLELAASHRASLIVVDVGVGELTGTDGASLIRRVRIDPALGDLLCVLLTAGEPGSELRALHAGADAFVRRGDVLDVIVARIHAVLRQRAAPEIVERGPYRILAIDDDLDYLEALGGLLRGEGHHVALAQSGAAALALLAVDAFDCILLDLHMPGFDGMDTCRRIKAAPMVRDIPLIVLTSTDDRDTTIEVLSAGADDLILKSSRFGVLQARVRAHLRRKQGEDDNRRMREALLAAEIEASEERAARELAQTQADHVEELQRKNHELEAFAYSVSHDLRAPLRSIIGFCRALAEDHGGRLDEVGLDHLHRVAAAGARMNELIDDMLELSRVGRTELRRTPVDLSELARQIAAELRRREPARRAEIAIEDGLVVHADGKLIRIVLENLMENAWKFTSKVDPARIEITGAGSPHGPAIRIRDNGAGFDAARVDRLFQPFRRLHSERDYDGTGIGLATVHRIIDRHGGRVWAEGATGAGATFWFTVERARDRRPTAPPGA